jgi:Zn-dependent protease with chaperone function
MRGGHPNGHVVVRLAAVLGAAGVLASAAALGAAIASVHHSSVGVRHLDIIGLRFSYPSFNTAEWVVLVLAGLGAAAAIVAARTWWQQRAAYREFLDQLPIIGELEGHPGVQVIADPRPQAFCAGYLRPTVYVSRRAVEALTEAELNAVLAHEHHHRLVRDPLRLTCGRIFSQALFFVPVLRSLYDRYADLAESSADQAAVQANDGRQAPLASALLAFDAGTPPGVSGISSQRVDSLLGNAARWSPPWWLMSASVASLLSLALLIWRTSALASAHATFNVPFLSSTPCVVISLLVPLLGCIAVARRRATSRCAEPVRAA